MAEMTTNTSNSMISDSSIERDPKSQTEAPDGVRKETASVNKDDPDSDNSESSDALPGWLQKQRNKRAAEKARAASSRSKPQSANVENPEDQSWKGTIHRWLAGFVAMGYGVSLLVHSLLLVIISLVILPHALNNRFEINGEITEGIEDEISEIIDTRIDLPAQNRESPFEVSLIPIPLSEEKSELKVNTIRKAIEESFGELEGEGDGGDLPNGGKKGKNAVTKGSFTAWTVPDDPKPGTHYHIVIEINLPKRRRRYSSRDLTGYVIGTDRYTIPIGFFQGGWIIRGGRFHSRKYYGHFNQKEKKFVIKVEGAEALVEDTIKVRSELLDEEQTLKIVF